VSERYRVTSLDDVEPLPGPGTLRWMPVRHELGIGAFGTNAYVARDAGDDVVEPHTEEGTGHEELYFVARGSATFTLDGETVPAPAGTYVFLPDPSVRRHVVADEPGTTVLSFGGWRDRPFEVSGWEARFRASAPPRSASATWGRRARSTRVDADVRGAAGVGQLRLGGSGVRLDVGPLSCLAIAMRGPTRTTPPFRRHAAPLPSRP
jgi:hypothetical protein